MTERATYRTAGRAAASGAVAVCFWILAWQVASAAVGSGLILAGPLDTVAALGRLVPTAAFWSQVGFSTLRIAGGTAAGYAVATSLAAASHRWRAVRVLLHPALAAIKGTPVACVVVVLLIWFGSRNVSAVAVFLMVLPTIYFSLLTGLECLSEGMEELLRTFRAGRRVRFGAHVWPGILPYLTAASRTALGMSWKAGVAAELIGVPTGSIGERIYQAKLLLETADLFAWTIVVVALSWAFERAVLALLAHSWPAAGRAAAQDGIRGTGGRVRCPASCYPRRTACGTVNPSPCPAASITARDLSVGHAGTAVCGPISFGVQSGGALCIMGSSGAGKTTLLRTVAGLLAPVAGEVGGAPEQLAAVFQDTRLVEDLTAVENIRLFAADGDAHHARALLAELLPQDALDVPVRALSGGQRRRVELVRAFAAPGDLVMLDEPFTGLDTAARQRAIAFIQEHRAGRTLLFATHDADDAKTLGAKVLYLE